MGGRLQRLQQNPALDAVWIISTEMQLTPCQPLSRDPAKNPTIRAIPDEYPRHQLVTQVGSPSSDPCARGSRSTKQAGREWWLCVEPSASCY